MPETEESAILPLLEDGSTDTPFHRFRLRRKLQEGILKKLTAQEQIASRMRGRLDVINTYLEDDEVWYKKLDKTSLRDLAIMEGVYIDKLQLVEGKPTSVISQPQQEKLDQLLPVLLATMKQRGLTIGLSERKLEFTT